VTARLGLDAPPLRVRRLPLPDCLALAGTGSTPFGGLAYGTSASPAWMPGAPLAIDNPRQVSAYRYPAAYGPRAPTFSRAALADVGGGELALFISGTASIVCHETRQPGDVVAQTEETLRNLDAVVAAANARVSANADGTNATPLNAPLNAFVHAPAGAAFDTARLDIVAYLRHADDAPRVRRVLEASQGPQPRTLATAVFLEADICRQDLLVEIEAHALAGAALRA
jgi:chorismate lyase / 3-hydroxybenzoate synthase